MVSPNCGSLPQLRWICLDCETRNTGSACVVCGCACPVQATGKEKGFPKMAVTAAAAGLVLLTLAAAGISRLTWWDYRNARALLEDGQYDQAYQAFSAIEGYRDSGELRNQTTLVAVYRFKLLDPDKIEV